MNSNEIVKAVAIVPLTEAIAINEDILGYVTRRLKISETKEIEICFPVIGAETETDYGKYFQWGGVYQTDRKGNVLNYRVSALLVKCYGDITGPGITIRNEVNKLFSTFVKILEFCNANTLCDHLSINRRGTPEKFPLSTWKYNDGKFLETGIVHLSEISATSTLTIENIDYAIDNAHREISLPYQMLHNARHCFLMQDYRGCILNCASAIEIPFRHAIDMYMQENLIPQKLRNSSIMRFNGINQVANLCKDLNIPLKYENKFHPVMTTRNSIIHGGKFPTCMETKPLLELTYEFLQEQCIDMFVE